MAGNRSVNPRGRGMTSQRARDRMVPMLQEMGIRDMRVLFVMREVPRHLFVEEALGPRAYENNALPIGQGQTISQPYIVARMSELLMAHGPRKVLEIGTGSGYQAAVLAQLEMEVYTVERIGSLYRRASRLLAELGHERVHCRHARGELGWPEAAPFDAIIATAAAERPPARLLAQLAPGGVAVMPVGPRRGPQTLLKITRREDDFETEAIEEVAFVPMISGRTE